MSSGLGTIWRELEVLLITIVSSSFYSGSPSVSKIIGMISILFLRRCCWNLVKKISRGDVASVYVDVAGPAGLGVSLAPPVLSTLRGLIFSRIEVRALMSLVCLRLF